MINILLLAAGSSSRMGESKQLLDIRGGDTLLAHTTKTAMASPVDKVIVVLGCDRHKHEQAIEGLTVEKIYNPEWEKGIGSSLKAGLKHMITSFPLTRAVIILVCDQPYLTGAHLTTIVNEYNTTQPVIIASRYADTLGVPALFDQSIFPELLDLRDEEGAKKIIKRHTRQVVPIDFPEGSVDLDTPADYRRYLEDFR